MSAGQRLYRLVQGAQPHVKPEPEGTEVLIVWATCSLASGAAEVIEATRNAIELAGGDVPVWQVGCVGRCSLEPLLEVRRPGQRPRMYIQVGPEEATEIVRRDVLGGEPIEDWLIESVEPEGEPEAPPAELPDHPAVNRFVRDYQHLRFFRYQYRIALRSLGRVDPEHIDDALAAGAYTALASVLDEGDPEAVVEKVKASGLRGRGGAGFPTGLKWQFTRQAEGWPKYVVCNADEGDPGAFMDRSLLEGDPHAVLEGMIIAGYAVGASRGFIYVRAEYPLAVRRLRVAIDQAREKGLLGKDILGSGFDFDIELRLGSGAFVCGEETALLASIEGKRGMPRPRPPFPAQKGLWGKPTLINNVETFGCVAPIINIGPDWFASIGTENSKGTKVFALAGKTVNTGLIEVPMGTTLRQIVFAIGGGIAKGRRFKAAQIGGPSGGCIPPRFLDMPIDYETVKRIGAIMGSGGLIVVDDATCMVDLARFFLEFTQDESCGKCVPCRIGTKRMLEILERVAAGRASVDELDKLLELAETVKSTSLCGLGQTAPNPVCTTLEHFREEYEEHIKLGRCRAAACEELVRSPCEHACPAGVNAAEYIGLIGEGRYDEAVELVRRRNPFVAVCARICDHPCESRCRRGELDEPVAIRALKRYAADHTTRPDRPLAPPVRGEPEIAIVGAGPAGLSCAYFLALMGRKAVVFERHDTAGGMLALGIPEFRLSRDALQRDIDFILSQGVELRTSSPVRSLAEVKQRFKAVFLATGAHNSRRLGVEGESLQGVFDSLEFLRDCCKGRPPSVYGTVVVIGGGNAAIDAARTAVRLGADRVVVAYRRTREEMPAYEEEVEQAVEEGVELQFLVSPLRFIGRDGRLAGVELVRMALGRTEADGRRRPVAQPGTEFVLDCAFAIVAIGQVPSLEPIAAMAPELVSQGRLEVDPVTLATGVEGVFAGGDVVSGGGSVIEAIAAGQRAAVAIDRRLGGVGQLPVNWGFSMRRPSEDEIEPGGRSPEEVLPVAERLCAFREVVGRLSEQDGPREARRCLRCDLERAGWLSAAAAGQ